MRMSTKRYIALWALVGLAVVGLIVAVLAARDPVRAQTAGPGDLIIGHELLTVGETAAVPMTVESAPGGIAGYQIRLSVADPAIASITKISSFVYFAVDGLDADSLEVAGVDLGEAWQAGATFPRLLNAEILAKGPGTTRVVAEVLRLDDDNGTAIPPSVASTLIVVSPPPP